MNNREKGKIAEDIAEAYYSLKGYKITTRNFHTHYGEIDLIVEKDDEVRIIEVKSSWYRIKDRNELGARLNKSKIRHLIYAFEKFVSSEIISTDGKYFIFEVLFILIGREHIEFIPFSSPLI